MQLSSSLLSQAMAARYGVAVVLGAVAALLVIRHWSTLFANLWLTYVGRRRVRGASEWIAPALAVAGLVVYPSEVTWLIGLFGVVNPATLLGSDCLTGADNG